MSSRPDKAKKRKCLACHNSIYPTSLGMWEFIFIFLMGQQLQEYFHLSGIKKNTSVGRGALNGETCCGGKALLLGQEENWRNDGDGCDKGKQGRKKDWGQTKKIDERRWEVFFFSEDSLALLLFPLFFLPSLRLISLLHVRTGSSQSQVKLVTRVLPFILPHLHFPFCSPALRQTSPSIWHHE